MRHEGWIGLAACALLACATSASAAGCTLGKYGTLSVEMIGERPTTLVKVNGAATRFAIDTGAWFNFMSRANAEALGLRLVPAPFGFRMGGIGGSASAEVATIKDLGFLDTDLHHVDFVVGGSDAGEGSLGANLLDFADLEIDLAHGKVTMFKPDGCRKSALAYWVRDGGTYNVADLHPSVDFNDRRSFVDVTINGKMVRALLDSGAVATLLDRRAAERVGIDLHGPGVRPGGRIGGLGEKTYQSWIVPIDSFSVGTETIQHSEMLVMDGNLGDGSTDMILGVDFMLAHHMYIANSQRKLYSLGEALNERCWARALANQSLDDALHDCREAIKRDGNRAAYLDSLGMVYLRMGKYAESIKAYQQALAQSPHTAWSHYGLGLAELHGGQVDAGKAELATARSLDKGIDARAAKLGLVAPQVPPASKASGAPPSKG